MTATAIATLTAAFHEAFTGSGLGTDRDRPAVVLSWPSVPVEIIRAAGLRPVFPRGSLAATPNADAHLEPEIFPKRLRHLVDAALAGRLSHAACIVVPRTSDPEYKCFLYLREFVRLGIARTLPPVLLFDLLQSDGPDVRDYNAGRTRALFEELASLTGRALSLEALHEEIAQANAARAAARHLASLRRGVPRLTGSEAMPLLGAFWHLPPAQYALLAAETAGEIARRPPLDRPRVLLAGAPADGVTLHAAIESHGAIVVAEISPWGSGSAGHDVVAGSNPMTALADKYRRDSTGARTPVHALRGLVAGALDKIDAVVVSLPPDDAVFGWDYPPLRSLLEARGLPHLCLQGDPYRPLTPQDHAQLDRLVARAAPLWEASHG
jgi:hypothetical protein